MNSRHYMTAREAAAALGVSRPTLYSYVSRGLIRSEAAESDSGRGGRARRYRAEDVARLQARKAQRRDPEKALAGSLYWGAPLLDSALTLIQDGHLYYRGWDAMQLAEEHSVEQVATLFWTGALPDGYPAPFDGPLALGPACKAVEPRVRHLGPVERFQVLLPLLAVDDPAAHDLRPEAVAQTGARMMRHMAAFAVGAAKPAREIVATLQRGWKLDDPRASELLSVALVLCADHELSASAFAARCVASAEASPYAAVLGGLAAFQGFRHCGSSARVEAFLAEAEGSADAAGTIAQRLRRGELVPGFGHPLYPEGDPRGRALLERIERLFPESPGTRLALALAEAGWTVLGQRPTLDLGLAAVARALQLPAGGAIGLFALGRVIGWIGHAIEQYATERLIRPRAHYVGPLPEQTA